MKKSFVPEIELMEIYNSMNPEGQKKWIEYADFLQSNGKYKKRYLG